LQNEANEFQKQAQEAKKSKEEADKKTKEEQEKAKELTARITTQNAEITELKEAKQKSEAELQELKTTVKNIQNTSKETQKKSEVNIQQIIELTAAMQDKSRLEAKLMEITKTTNDKTAMMQKLLNAKTDDNNKLIAELQSALSEGQELSVINNTVVQLRKELDSQVLIQKKKQKQDQEKLDIQTTEYAAIAKLLREILNDPEGKQIQNIQSNEDIKLGIKKVMNEISTVNIAFSDFMEKHIPEYAQKLSDAKQAGTPTTIEQLQLMTNAVENNKKNLISVNEVMETLAKQHPEINNLSKTETGETLADRVQHMGERLSVVTKEYDNYILQTTKQLGIANVYTKLNISNKTSEWGDVDRKKWNIYVTARLVSARELQTTNNKLKEKNSGLQANNGQLEVMNMNLSATNQKLTVNVNDLNTQISNLTSKGQGTVRKGQSRDSEQQNNKRLRKTRETNLNNQ